ncbi:MAG: YbhN family protein [Faecousia sp.]
MTKQTRKRIFSAVFFFCILALTFWYVFRDENLSKVADYLADADGRYVALSVAAVIAFILGESVVLCYLLHRLGTNPKFSHCCLFSFVGFFYSAITPSASGGQPMQVFYMRRDGIPGAVSTVVLAIVTITYKLVLVVVGLAVMVLRPSAVIGYLDGVEALMYIGLALNVVFIAVLLTAVFHPGAIQCCMKLVFTLLNKIRPFRNPEKVMARVQSNLDCYHGTAAFFRQEPKIIVNVFFITLLQRLCLFSVVWFTYLAFGLSGENALVMILLQAMISVAVDMLPLPGGMGISETLFLAIFAPVFGPELVLPGMIVCRGISYYTQLVISGIMTGAAQFVFREKKQK